MRKDKNWSIHACGWLSRDENCRAFGAPRIHMKTPYRNIGVALTPDARFASKLHGRPLWVLVVHHTERLH